MLIDVDKKIFKKQTKSKQNKYTMLLFVSLFEKVLQRETNSFGNLAEGSMYQVVISSSFCVLHYLIKLRYDKCTFHH